jgi:curved DNA-binding protein CbpA
MYMHLKDYFQILDLPPSATITDIKKAYRKMAHQLHPDKNPGDAYAANQFAEIKEAYEVLTNPAKKEYYLQQRWYEQSIGKKTKQAIITPASMVQLCVELDRHVARLDTFRMDKEGLRDYILALIPSNTIQQLKEYKEEDVNLEIIKLLLKAMEPLPLAYTSAIIQQLRLLADTNPQGLTAIDAFEKRGLQHYKTQRYSLLIIVLITALLCCLIWLSNR